jgi:hypothetical protein
MAGQAKEINTMAELDSLLDGDGDADNTEDIVDDVEDTEEDVAETEEEIDTASDEADDNDDTVEDDLETEEDSTDDVDDSEDDSDNDEEKKKDVKTRPKDQHAFAQMRKQNKQLQETIDNLARGLGIDPKEGDTMNQLSDLAYKGIAKREGKTKEEVIADSQAQRELKAYRRKDITANTTKAFESIKNDLGADNKRLNDFAQKLVKQGYDLLGQKEDWTGMYKSMYFDELKQEFADKAVEEALKRDRAADEKSGKSKKRGKRGGGGAKKVTTMSELDKLLDKI